MILTPTDNSVDRGKRGHHIGDQGVDCRARILQGIAGDAAFGGRRPRQHFLLGVDEINGQRTLLVIDRLDRRGVVDPVITAAVAVITAGVAYVGRPRGCAYVLLVLNIDVKIEQQVRRAVGEHIALGFHHMTGGVLQVLGEQ